LGGQQPGSVIQCNVKRTDRVRTTRQPYPSECYAHDDVPDPVVTNAPGANGVAWASERPSLGLERYRQEAPDRLQFLSRSCRNAPF
jgi:hypothetical protein